MPPRPPHERHVPSSAILGFIDRARVDGLLQPLIPGEEDRAFVLRCILGEGPAHHRGANWVLLTLLGEVLARVPAGPAPEGEWLQVPMRLPPHLAKDLGEDQAYPLGLPAAALERLAPRGTRDFDAMVDTLTDGPPQHALANVAMVALLHAVLLRLEGDAGR